MPRLVRARPNYCRHKGSGQALVKIEGKVHCLGKFGTAASYKRFDRLIAEWLTKGRAPLPHPEAIDVTVTELIAAYWRFAAGHYVKHGVPTAEQDCIRSAFRPLRRLYGITPAIKFGPLALRTVRQAMIDAGMCRGTINKHVGRIRRMFRWATAEEMLPASVHQALAALPGLQRGRTTAREPEPIQPVSDAVVEATLPFLPAVVADMVRFQRLTGCRPEEVCMIRPCDVDTSSEVWQYVPEAHKMEHHGKRRTIFIGPRAQDVLRPYLLRAADSYCFSPADSERKRLAAKHEARRTPLHYGNRPGTNQRRNSKRIVGDRYDTNGYRHCITRACDKAFPPVKELSDADLKAWQKAHHWAPNRLRHTAATELRKRFGLEAAQVILGHSSADVTQIYAERDAAKAIEAILGVG
jgi:integrase